MTRRRRPLGPFAALIATLLAACSSIPEPPPDGVVLTDTAVLPVAWTERLRSERDLLGGPVPQTVWVGFDDADLLRLVTAAITDTPDIRAAQARIRQARAAVAIAEARRRPSLSLSSTVSRDRASEEAQIFPMTPGMDGGFEIPLETDSYGVTATASWEPDVWGEEALRVASAELTADAAEAAATAVALSLQSETARTYIQLRGAQARLGVLGRNIELLEENRRLTDLLVGRDLSPRFDLVQVEADLEALRAEVVAVEATAVARGYALSTLTGQPPQAIDDLLLDDVADIPAYSGGIAPGLPSDLLLRRPDLVQAGLELRATRLDVEAEELNRLPTFSLTGEGGLLSMTLEALISEDARRGLLSVALNWPVYQGGRLNALREQAEATEDLASANYDAAILIALRDVEQAFEEYVAANRRLTRLDRAVSRREEVLELAELRFRSGLDSQFRVLEAQTALLNARTSRVDASQAAAEAIVRINAALGGYWGGSPSSISTP